MAVINVDLKSLLGRLNPYCTRALETAAGVCVSRGGYEVAVEHLLLVMIDDPDRDFQLICQHYGVDPGRVKKALQRSVEEGKTGNTGKPVFSPLLLEWFEDAWLIGSVDLALAEIRSGVLIAALRANPGRYAYGSWADELDAIPAEALRREVLQITAPSKEGAAAMEKGSGKGGGKAEAGARDDTALGRFTIDFTGRARAGDIDPVFCRDREIRQMIDILGRRRKNNPIAVGEAGVGKTAVVEGLALKVVEGDVPEILQGVEIYALDLGLLQAGAGVKGEFESRLRAVIDEVKASPKPIILFIDEAHTLIGAGGAAGGGDAANLLKPALARGELRTVAATTWSEYKKYFEKDPALARRFQLVKLDEPSPDDAVTIIRGLRERYEQAHGVYVRDDAVEAAARLSARYISGRQLPDKAVDVLDTAAARVKISITAKPDQVDDRERRIRTLEREVNAIQRDMDAGTRADDGRVAELNQTIAGIRTELEALDARWQAERAQAEHILELRRTLAGGTNGQGAAPAEAAAGESSPAPAAAPAGTAKVDRAALMRELDEATRKLAAMQGTDPLVHYEVSPDVVGRVIGDWTGIPVGKMVRDEARTILEFAGSLKKRIKGQDHAIDALDQGIRSAKAGLSNPGAPMGVFLLVGPSGVGKTETGLGVADLLFGGERFMVTINMSEFQEKHTVSRLIGSPPGYVGYGEGGMLTEAVRQRPYTVVLLDEVEKADPEVLNLFYQVFDKGMLSDGEGRVVDFKNTVILMTSNLATDILTEIGQGEERPGVEAVTEAIRPVLSAHFKPALLARMEIVPYFPISGDAMKEITALKLGRLAGRMEQSQKIKLVWKPEVIEQIARRCTEVETGARNVDHIVNRTLLPRISTQILEMMGEEERPDRLEVGVGADGDFTFAFKTGGK